MFSGLTFMEIEENPVMVLVETLMLKGKKHDGICLFTTNGISQNHSNGKFIAMNVFCIKNINGFSSAFPLMYFNMLFYHFPLKKTRMIF